VLHPAVVAHRHQHTSRSRMQAGGVDLLLVIQIELLQALAFRSYALPSNALGDDKQQEQKDGKRDSLFGGDLLRKEVRDQL